jgi:peroxiredoxin
MKSAALAAFCLLGLPVAFGGDVTRLLPAEVLNFALIDEGGRLHELRRIDAKVVVLFFTANGCPVARHSTPKLTALQDKFADRGVKVFLVNSNSADDRRSIAKEAAALRLGRLPVLKDDTQGVARHLGVKRTAEAIAISTRDWTIVYRGAIDDQLAEGAQKPQPTERYLENALDQFLAGQPVNQPKTVAHGCLIHFDGGEGPDSAPVSYAQEIAPLLATKCLTCHSEGNIGSWAMSDFQHVKGMASMIEEVILTRRMPPWDADPQFGKFENEASLTVAQAQILLRWIEQGALRGDGPDLLATTTIPPAEDWPLGKPDIVVRLPRPQQIPATGVLEYRHIDVPAGNANEGWVGGAWVKPGNKQVVHHVIARLKDEDDGKKRPEERQVFAGWAPGSTQGWTPKGTGKFLPANARFEIELHYTPNGTPQTDQTEVGFYLLPEKPAKVLETVAAYNTKFEIKPGDSSAETFAMYGFKQAAMLYNIAPHMHLRGRWMQFELLRPDGKRETICSVPRWDFNWQRTYKLTQPRRIPAGTWLLVTGSYDNSHRNPSNPDPSKTVRWGDQSFDEMFIGFLGITWEK